MRQFSIGILLFEFYISVAIPLIPIMHVISANRFMHRNSTKFAITQSIYNVIACHAILHICTTFDGEFIFIPDIFLTTGKTTGCVIFHNSYYRSVYKYTYLYIHLCKCKGFLQFFS